jgi:hypothetical protein
LEVIICNKKYYMQHVLRYQPTNRHRYAENRSNNPKSKRRGHSYSPVNLVQKLAEKGKN